jgi:hypothetical protein
MATYFVFGKAPTIPDLIEATVKGERTYINIKIVDSGYKLRHKILNINGHSVGIQLDEEGIISAVYQVNEDHDGVKLLNMLIEKWSDENSEDEDEPAVAVIDDELVNYFEQVE